MPVEPDFIPEEPEALTPEWLSGVLGFPIRGVQRQVLGEGQGFLGDIIRLRLDHDEPGKPATVIAKMPKLANRSIGELLGVYERELLFFRGFGQDVPARIPEIYFSHYDPDPESERTKSILATCDQLPRLVTRAVFWLGKRIAAARERRYLLLMEDLGTFEAGDQLEPASVEVCGRVLEQFAAVHRRFWGMDSLDEHHWLFPLDLDAKMRHDIYLRGLREFREIAPPGLLPHIEKRRKLGAELTRRLASEAPRTLIHCDLRLDNVCFDGDQCAFLDWQLVRSGPAAYDVAYFLGGALAPETDAADEEALLRRYHDALGVADYPFERLRRDYQRALFVSLAALAPTDEFEIDEGRGQEMMQRWRERLLARLEHVDADRLI